MAWFRWAQRTVLWAVVAAAVLAPAAADPGGPLLDLSVRQLPLRAALERLYAGDRFRARACSLTLREPLVEIGVFFEDAR